ncbi:hypothetical protein GX563_03035 [Candidatus Bathyarchaeota archaeon]|nr:hypothetical protein [Candidatus Bathyarchaeota archaeon]
MGVNIKRQILLLMPTVFLGVLIFTLAALRIETPVFVSPLTLTLLNTVFLTGLFFAVVAISARSYIADGSANFLFMGTSALIISLSALSSSLASGISTNVSITIYTSGFLLASILLFWSAVRNPTGSWTSKREDNIKRLALTFGSAVAFVAVLSLVSFADLTPVFYSSAGSSDLRDFFVWASIFLFTVSSVVFGVRYRRLGYPVLFWSSIGLVSFVFGLVGITLFVQFNDLINWVGRVAQYLGGVYFLVAVLRRNSAVEYPFNVGGSWVEAFSSDPKQFSTLFSKMLNGFMYCHVVVGSDGRAADILIAEVNPAYERLTGLRREQVVNKRLTEIYPNFEGSAELIRVLGDVGLSGVPVSFVTYFEPFHGWFSLSVYSPRHGDFISIFEDVTEFKRAQDVAREANRQLEEYSADLERTVDERTRQLKNAERLAAIGSTAGMVGHDIRNPLQAIVGDIFLVKQELSDSVDSELKKTLLDEVDAIEANVFYINKIVADLQDYARPLNPVFKEVDIEALIVAALLSKFVPNNIETSYHVDSDAKIVCTDQDMLKRILNNLGMNAIQAMPNGGKVRVEVFRRDDATFITVADTGEGISEEVKSKLFTPMFTTKSKGQGFGLVVVKRLTEALGGSVSFESEPGKGTKFMVKLPG